MPSKDVTDFVQFWAAVASIVTVPFGIIAVIYAAGQLSLARKAGSGASLIALSEAFRQCWLAFVSAPDDRGKRHAFGDLANALEVACAVFKDRVFYGRSKDLLEHYLIHIFHVIGANQDARNRLVALLQTPRTFENIVKFLAEHRDARF